MTMRKMSDAVDRLADVFGDPMFASDNGHHFTCSETDAVLETLVIAGHHDAAVTFLTGHLQGDDRGDDHVVSLELEDWTGEEDWEELGRHARTYVGEHLCK